MSRRKIKGWGTSDGGLRLSKNRAPRKIQAFRSNFLVRLSGNCRNCPFTENYKENFIIYAVYVKPSLKKLYVSGQVFIKWLRWSRWSSWLTRWSPHLSIIFVNIFSWVHFLNWALIQNFNEVLFPYQGISLFRVSWCYKKSFVEGMIAEKWRLYRMLLNASTPPISTLCPNRQQPKCTFCPIRALLELVKGYLLFKVGEHDNIHFHFIFIQNLFLVD